MNKPQASSAPSHLTRPRRSARRRRLAVLALLVALSVAVGRLGSVARQRANAAALATQPRANQAGQQGARGIVLPGNLAANRPLPQKVRGLDYLRGTEGDVSVLWSALQEANKGTPAFVAQAFAASKASPAPKQRPNILVITCCSMRADHLGCYGYAAAHTPTIDALAAHGTRFAHAWTTATFTLPSHASLLTGRLPARCGVVQSSDHLPTNVPTLPQLLHDAGYRTYAWASVGSSASFRSGDGLERGFDRFFDGATAKRWLPLSDELCKPSKQPFFAVAHFKNAHLPYGDVLPTDGPVWQQWLARTREFSNKHEGVEPDRWLRQQLDKDPSFRKDLLARYDRGLSRDDADLRGFLEQLGLAGMLTNTWVVLLGDHGEALTEEVHVGHQILVPTVLHIPLLVMGPGIRQGLAQDDVSVADLAPTLLDLAHVPPPGGLDGRSLVPSLHGGQLPPRPAFAQALVRPKQGETTPQQLSGYVGVVSWPYFLRLRLDNQRIRTSRLDGPGKPDEATKLRLVTLARQAQGGFPTRENQLTPEQRREIQRAGYW